MWKDTTWSDWQFKNTQKQIILKYITYVTFLKADTKEKEIVVHRGAPKIAGIS